ncbi:EscU/YscU/HrcU family type III secretion system export apparatus switch protein [Candidatus Latescibacterota bacterium]
MNDKQAKKRTKPRKSAAALRYKEGKDHAPRLVAKGMGDIAEKIIAAAENAGVPVHEDPDLLALLMTLDIQETIPQEMYLAVAEVLAFIYKMNNTIPVLK